MLMIMRGTLHGRLRNYGSVGILWSETGGLRKPSRVSGQHAEHKTTVLVKPLIFKNKRKRKKNNNNNNFAAWKNFIY